MKKQTVEFCGIIGVGVTKAEAKSDAVEKIEGIFNEGIAPSFVSNKNYPGYVGVVWQEGYHQWAHTIISPDSPNGGGSTHYGAVDRTDAIRNCAKALAQRVMVVDDDKRTGLEFLQHENDQRAHIGYIAWQRSFRKAVESGMSSGKAHAVAFCDMELVKGIAL